MHCTIEGFDITNNKNFLGFHKTAICGKKDHYCKETGRRVSLAKVLLAKTESDPDGVFEREFRTKVWEVYRTLTKVPRWKTEKDREIQEVNQRVNR